jgi:hypothetical protein
MKFIVEVKDSKAEFLLELLRSLSFVKARPMTADKEKVLDSVRAAVKEMKQVKAGKLKGRPVQALLNEL